MEVTMEVRSNGGSYTFFNACSCCGMEFQCGPHIYQGQNVPGWGIPMCDICKPPFRLNHEVSPTSRLIAILHSKGIAVTLNANGMLVTP